MASDDFLENPALIHDGPDLPAHAQPVAPLIMIHDGGGTTFSYHCMDPTSRALYGIQNPHMEEGGWWDGGIAEMSRHYIELLSAALPEGGNIILGGWSMGGILSMEMAHQLATAPPSLNRPRFRVLGMVMVDTVFRKKLSETPGESSIAGEPRERVVRSAAQLKAMKLKKKVDLNMDNARVMIRAWDPPRWEGGLRVPPTILLRARDLVPEDEIQSVDAERRERYLGWEKYSKAHGDFIRQIVDVDGHHFSVFHNRYISDITKKICAAADALDKPDS